MFQPAGEEYLITLFEYAPISLWEQDFSSIKRLFDELRQTGVESLESYLDEHPSFVDECMRQIKVLNVNEKTVSMLGAKSKADLAANLDRVFRDGMRHHFREELLALWNGDESWSGEGINYTLDGDPLDILLHWRILPEYKTTWERVLVTIENITARKRAERRFQSLFESSPISLWEEDYSAIKAYFDLLREQGVENLQEYLEKQPDLVSQFAGLIKVINVNQKTLELFGASSKQHLNQNLELIFRDEMKVHFAKELVDLWNGKLVYEREGINYSLAGEPINIQLDFRIMPGHEDDFSWALVSIQDITSRKKAEEYLRYLGTHDAMTGLYNRAFFEETIIKLENQRKEPISIVVLDLNYLKRANDTLGHQAGDKLIRRTAEVITAAFGQGHVAARIGGDEFAAVLTGVDEVMVAEYIKQIHALIALNNKYYREPELSISIGASTSFPGVSLEKVIGMADDAMYRNKSEYHRRRRDDL
ncbi:MAG: sensor domain-containing diguanylate cyclase [Anaerolineales bacterium]|nr:sensor domain-containing diguanylate cyclase [Anaerolineales bacterium]